MNIGDAYHGKQGIEEAAASAAHMWAYCNLEAESSNEWATYREMNGRQSPYRVRFFEIGNEVWGFEGFQWKTDYDREQVLHLYDCIKAVADTLKALDPEVQIIVDGPIPELNELLESAPAKQSGLPGLPHLCTLGYFRILPERGHCGRGPGHRDANELWKAWVATPIIDPATGTSTLPSDRYHQSALEYGFPVAATEWNWNGWLEGDAKKSGLAEPDLAKGIGAAGFLHAMMRHGDRVTLACQSMTVGQSWGITGIRVDPDYQQDAVLLPTAQVTGLYAAYHGNERLRIETRNIPAYAQPYWMSVIQAADSVCMLDMVATRNASQLFVHVINRSFVRSFDLGLELEGLEAGRDFVRHTLTGEKNAEISNDTLKQGAWTTTTPFSRSGRSLVLEVPESTVNVFVFDLE